LKKAWNTVFKIVLYFVTRMATWLRVIKLHRLTNDRLQIMMV